MKWSWNLGQVGGIKLRVHATFVILLAWLAILDYGQSRSIAGAAVGTLFTIALFASVLLHELGHAMVACRCGIPTRDITLLPIGGVARVERMPDQPRQELAIALAGPAVTLVIALVLGLGLVAAGVSPVSAGNAITHRTPGAFLAQLAWANVVLLAFKLLPAFPMDGGRVLRALLALRIGAPRATGVAMRVGRGFALVFGIFGLLYSPILAIIALFIWVSAAAESAELEQRTALAGINVGRVMISTVETLSPHDTLNEALQLVLKGFQQDFPVLDGTRVVGVLNRSSFLQGLARHGAGSLVASSMATEFPTATPQEPVTAVISRMHDARCRTVPVITGGELRGLLTLDNVAEYVLIDAALHASQQPEARRPAPDSQTESQNRLTGALQ